MHRRRVLIDLSHMSERSLGDTFDLLDELDPGRTTPVFATHAGYRFGTQEYMLATPTIERIKERDGVVGLIFAQHQLYDGLVEGPQSPIPPGRGCRNRAASRIRFRSCASTSIASTR